MNALPAAEPDELISLQKTVVLKLCASYIFDIKIH